MFKYFFSKSEFSKNVLTLVSGTTISQIVVLATAPILSRIYSPQEFGIFATYFSIVSAIVIFSAGRYELAIVLPETDEEAINLFAIAFIINIFVSVVSLLISLVVIFFFAVNFHLSDKLIFWLYFIPLFVFLIGTYQVLNNWAMRKKNYKSISQYRISNSLATVLTNIGFGVFLPGESGLFIGNLLGNLVSLFVFWKTAFSNLRSLASHINTKEMKAAAIKYKHFPLTNSFLAASGIFQVSGIIYFTSYFFNQAVVGAFSYTIRVLQAPMNFIGGAISQVFYQQASIIKADNEQLKKLVFGTIKKSSFVSLPFLIVLLLWGPQLFAFVFGKEWEIAGQYARILSPWIFLDFIRATVSQLVLIVEKQKPYLIFSVLGNLILILSMMIGGMVTHNILDGFMIFSACNSLLTVYILFWMYKLSGEKKDNFIN